MNVTQSTFDGLEPLALLARVGLRSSAEIDGERYGLVAAVGTCKRHAFPRRLLKRIEGRGGAG